MINSQDDFEVSPPNSPEITSLKGIATEPKLTFNKNESTNRIPKIRKWVLYDFWVSNYYCEILFFIILQSYTKFYLMKENNYFLYL